MQNDFPFRVPELEPPFSGEPGYRLLAPARPEHDQPRRDPLAGVRRLGRRIWGMLAAVGAFLAKFWAVIWKLKVLTVAGSMIVSVGAYALLGGWWFGVGLVGLLFVHEMGHVIALRRQGVPASAPLFIPFLGAVIGMKRMPVDAWHEAEVAIAGPLLGSLGAAAVWALGSLEHSRFLVALAFIGFFLNLFNLIPLVPLDGGRVVAALHPAIWLLGLGGLLALEILQPSPILPLILIVGGLELWRRWRTRGLAGASGYYRVARWQRAVVASAYLGLAAALVLAMSATYVPGSGF